ncbi:MAG TPA: GGDEF domain-containing protein [Rectinemataceae bacterium]|nr:GGDEF domain-containing protein [Rectinemataceae bacterium]
MKKSGKQEESSPGLPAAVEVLSKAMLFSAFSADELVPLAEKSEFLLCEDGQSIFEPGDPGDRLYLVATGTVDVHSSEDGSALAQFVPGDSFGELDLLTRTRRNARARAVGPSLLLAFPKGGQSLEEALASRPEVAARILRSFLLVVSGRTRKANSLVKENSPWVRELRRQVYGDKLTGLLNKTYLDENLPKLLSDPTALVMLKPDNFKEINDRFGHEIGDAALVLMAGELERELGKEGTALRYSGNELAVIFPGKGRAGALQTARVIQARLSALDLSPLTGDPSLRFGISLGIALFPEHGNEAESLVKACVGLPLLGRSRGGKAILFPEDGE